MLKLNLFIFFTIMLLTNLAFAEDCSQYQINMKELSIRQAQDRSLRTLATLQGQPAPSYSRAEEYITTQRQLYQACKANQAGMSYEETICNGDSNCIQRYDLQNQYTNAMQNQHMSIDANLNHSGTVNVNNYHRFNY